MQAELSGLVNILRITAKAQRARSTQRVFQYIFSAFLYLREKWLNVYFKKVLKAGILCNLNIKKTLFFNRKKEYGLK